jgi:lantibiotic modifying enzyme
MSLFSARARQTSMQSLPASRARQESFLDAADRIGAQLADAAIWYEGRCNWVGARFEEKHEFGEITHASLGPNLYAGTSGIAVFLANLAAVTGDRGLRRTAFGAINHAVDRYEDQGRVRSGLYEGGIGVALAAAWTGMLLHNPGLDERAVRIGMACTGTSERDDLFDLGSGISGAVVGALCLWGLLGDRVFLDRAARVGDDLTQVVDRRVRSSWENRRGVAELTGFLHGTAGVGWALLELAEATGDSRYREAAKQVFDHLRCVFDPVAQNWPDFRVQEGRRRSPRGPWPCATSWCNGAPGIALSLLRADQLVPDPTSRGEAVAGLRTTAKEVREALHAETADYSLCHGLTGNAMVLQDSWSGPDLHPLTVEVAETGLARHGSGELPWPCGTYDLQTPNLFLDVAGIGMFYLRLCDPSLPSPCSSVRVLSRWSVLRRAQPTTYARTRTHNRASSPSRAQVRLTPLEEVSSEISSLRSAIADGLSFLAGQVLHPYGRVLWRSPSIPRVSRPHSIGRTRSLSGSSRDADMPELFLPLVSSAAVLGGPGLLRTVRRPKRGPATGRSIALCDRRRSDLQGWGWR